jgi:DNA-binding MarR family transcriptional regulator
VSASQGKPLSARNGLTSERSQTALRALLEPGRAADVANELDVDVGDAWRIVRDLVTFGYVERLTRGVYQATPAGREVLATPGTKREPQAKAKRKMDRHEPVPPGRGIKGERLKWLARHYELLGDKRCGELLGTTRSAAKRAADKLGLRWGDLPGHVLLVDLADLGAGHYANVYARAKRAGVLYRPPTTKRKLFVPTWWADKIMAERDLPTPDEVAVQEVINRLGVPETSLLRAIGGRYRLATPAEGGNPKRYITRALLEDVERLFAERRRQPHWKQPGKAGVIRALQESGGLNEIELSERLGVSRNAIRIHLRQLRRIGRIERCRKGSSADPFVYRLAGSNGTAAPRRNPPKGLIGRPPNSLVVARLLTQLEPHVPPMVVEALKGMPPGAAIHAIKTSPLREHLQERAA